MHRLFGLLALCLTLTSGAASAREAITSFDSDVTILEDASLRVAETIIVSAEGREIRRGIVREFPTTYKDKLGHRYKVAFEVESVKRNGTPEPWFTKKRSNGIELYIGEKNKFLSAGTHRFEITYRTDRQIAYYEDFDELYWNVTGNGWFFPIDHASAQVQLPEGVPADKIKLEGFTGYQDDKGKNYTAQVDEHGNAVFVTTKPLLPELVISASIYSSMFSSSNIITVCLGEEPYRPTSSLMKYLI